MAKSSKKYVRRGISSLLSELHLTESIENENELSFNFDPNAPETIKESKIFDGSRKLKEHRNPKRGAEYFLKKRERATGYIS